jgi:heat shock protein HslJ
MSKFNVALGTMMSGLLLASCSTIYPEEKYAGHALTQQTWLLKEIAQRNAWPIQLAPAQQSSHQVQFKSDGTAQFFLDCNRGTTNWSATPSTGGSGRLQIGLIAATRALCAPPSYGEAMATDLPTAVQFTVIPGGRSLNIVTANNVYTFEAAGNATQMPGDALVPGTEYQATAQIRCQFTDRPNVSRCEAGVKRKWGADGTSFVEVKKPDGRTRAIFFRGTTAYGADSAQSDGSAGWTFRARRRNDETVIDYGPERYVIPDALVVGG